MLKFSTAFGIFLGIYLRTGLQLHVNADDDPLAGMYPDVRKCYEGIERDPFYIPSVTEWIFNYQERCLTEHMGQKDFCYHICVLMWNYILLEDYPAIYKDEMEPYEEYLKRKADNPHVGHKYRIYGFNGGRIWLGINDYPHDDDTNPVHAVDRQIRAKIDDCKKYDFVIPEGNELNCTRLPAEDLAKLEALKNCIEEATNC